jgi:hypothetical protein
LEATFAHTLVSADIVWIFGRFGWTESVKL